LREISIGMTKCEEGMASHGKGKERPIRSLTS